jgi:hypothetical protein
VIAGEDRRVHPDFGVSANAAPQDERIADADTTITAAI